jgi:hypothetical protein
MSAGLDPMRRWLGGRSRSSPGGIPSSAVTASTPGDTVEALEHRTRRALGVVTVLAGGAALTQHALAGALAASHGTGVLGAAHAVLTWPTPLAQPVLAGVGAFVLSMIGIQSRGWRHITRRQYWYLSASAVVAVLGAAPMVLVCVLTVVAVALAVMVGLMIFFGLLVLRLVLGRR